MSHAELDRLLKNFGLTEVYFGFEGFRIFTPEELPEAQTGYSRHPDGTDLTGQGDGDWKREWTVIGYDANLGDPYFVDTSQERFPVYTAMHGAGRWDPDIVSPALDNFLQSLSHLRSQSPQDFSLIEPDDAILTDQEKINALKQTLSQLNGANDFWEDFFERHIDRLEENEEDDL